VQRFGFSVHHIDKAVNFKISIGYMHSSEIHSIIKKAKAGNRQAQKLIYEHYKVYLFGVAQLYSRYNEDAEDILLEGFYRIFKDLKSYNGQGDLRAWMRKVIVNTALMHIRQYRKWDDIRTYQDESVLHIPDDIDFTEKDRVRSILALVRGLPEPQGIIFTLKGIEGYSFKEIAKKLEIKESTLRSHYLRARKNLQVRLQKELK